MALFAHQLRPSDLLEGPVVVKRQRVPDPEGVHAPLLLVHHRHLDTVARRLAEHTAEDAVDVGRVVHLVGKHAVDQLQSAAAVHEVRRVGVAGKHPVRPGANTDPAALQRHVAAGLRDKRHAPRVVDRHVLEPHTRAARHAEARRRSAVMFDHHHLPRLGQLREISL